MTAEDAQLYVVVISDGTGAALFYGPFPGQHVAEAFADLARVARLKGASVHPLVPVGAGWGCKGKAASSSGVPGGERAA